LASRVVMEDSDGKTHLLNRYININKKITEILQYCMPTGDERYLTIRHTAQTER